MVLTDLKIQESAYISKILLDNDMKRRLYDLGFFKGTRIECVLESPFKSPILYRVGGAFLALRRDMAERIEISYEE